MRFTTLGANCVTVSRICLGFMSYGDPKWRPWMLDEDAAQPFFQDAIAALDITLSAEEITALEAPYRPRALVS